MIKVLKPGIEVTVQDLGRIGTYDMAMPPSGALDEFSYLVANWLVGNPDNAAALEITYLGPELVFQTETTIAITGAEMPPKINGVSIPMWESVTVKPDDRLSFDFVKSGARTYLAVAGGIDVPRVLGSRSTYPTIGIGGFEGRKLQPDDILPIGNHPGSPGRTIRRLPGSYIPQYGKCHEIRVVVGMCSYRFTEESMTAFFESEWIVTPEANRVGYRLKGERMHFVPREPPFGAGSDPSNIVDAGYPLGSIQVPGGIEPIVLMKDAVTCGGFATLGTVISVDLNKMGQIKSNERIRFVSVTLEESLAARKQFRHLLAEIKSQLL
jgi:biotin-dependent carboxylase-like uncharacterized protein